MSIYNSSQVFKINSAFYLGFAKRLFLISNVSASNKTLCREQYFARELRVERASYNLYSASDRTADPFTSPYCL
jgi:hypothetical protein